MDPDGDNGFAYSISRRKAATELKPFIVGSGIIDYESSDGTTLVILFIWQERLSPQQIWQFYIKGGTMS